MTNEANKISESIAAEIRSFRGDIATEGGRRQLATWITMRLISEGLILKDEQAEEAFHAVNGLKG